MGGAGSSTGVEASGRRGRDSEKGEAGRPQSQKEHMRAGGWFWVLRREGRSMKKVEEAIRASDGLLGRSSIPRCRVGRSRGPARPEGAGCLGLWCK